MWSNLLKLFQSNNLFDQALKESHTMLDLDWEMYQASVESLRNSETGAIKIDIFAKDKEINAYERDVRKKILTHLAVSGNTADLPSGLVLASIVNDIERIGDYTKNIYDLACQHPSKLQASSVEPQLREAEAGVTELFKDMIEAFKASDEEGARQIMRDYKESLSANCESITMGIVSGEVSDLKSADAAATALYARYLKRIAAHSRNIMSSVVNPFHRIGYKEKLGTD
jgi:phosphate transport system protein